MQEAELTYIEGTVDAVIYQNRENGYTVLRLDAGEGRGLTVVGCLPGVAPGESISVQGTWMHHASYGEQFKAETVERRMPAGTKAIFDYLASGAVRGIGAATARRMVEEFGEEALTVLEEHPERLTQIKGITRKRALAMGEHFRQQMGMRRLLEFLGEHEVPLQLAMPLYRKYGDRALEIIRGNPYLLVDRELGVDFSNADALALSMGMEGDDPQRLEAGLLFELTHNLDNGHTFLPRRKLLPATAQLIGVGEEALEEALEALLERGEVVEEPVAGEQAVYLHDLCEAEQYVAFRLWELAAGEIVAAPWAGGTHRPHPGRAGHHLCPTAAPGSGAGRHQPGDAPHRRTGHRQDHLPAWSAGPVRCPGAGDRPGRPHGAGRQAAGGAVRRGGDHDPPPSGDPVRPPLRPAGVCPR